jgi:hypothetical protein
MRSAPSSSMKSAFKGRGRMAAPASGFPRLVRKTALLNLGMVLSCLAIGAHLGRPASLVILLLIVPMVSIILWSATFAISAFVALFRIFCGQGLRSSRQGPRPTAHGGGVGDEWLDGPV